MNLKHGTLYFATLLLYICPSTISAQSPKPDHDATLFQYVEAKILTEERSTNKIEGQLLATYDHSAWWDNSNNIFTCAIFQRTLFFATPCDLDYMELKTPPPGFETYRDAMRRRGIVLSHFPLAQTTQAGSKILPYILMGNEGWHRNENGHGNFAWDIVRADEQRKTYKENSNKKDLFSYYAWQSRVELPAGGTVVKVVNNVPDNPEVGEILEGVRPEGNYIALQIENGLTLYLLHLNQNSIVVKEGQALNAGTFVGLVGNSGTSIEPHLHLAVTFGNREWGVPLEFENLYTSKTGPKNATLMEYTTPLTGSWCSFSNF